MQTGSTNYPHFQDFVFAAPMYWCDWLAAPVLMVCYKGDFHVSSTSTTFKEGFVKVQLAVKRHIFSYLFICLGRPRRPLVSFQPRGWVRKGEDSPPHSSIQTSFTGRAREHIFGQFKQ
jgi:hypothetical protein